MILALSYAPVIEEILVTRLKKYLYEDCQWNDLYKNHPVRIGNEYPWVPYMNTEEYYANGYIKLEDDQEALFPNITIVSSQDNESPQKFVDMKRTELLKEEYDDFKSLVETEGYMIAPSALTAMETHFDTNDALYGLEICYQNRDSMNIDITTDDPSNIKNRIYDFCELYLKAHGALELMQNYNIEIVKQSINGNRSGIYNIDFGRVLRGATIGFEANYTISQIFYDTEASLIDDVNIDHTVGVK